MQATAIIDAADPALVGAARRRLQPWRDWTVYPSLLLIAALGWVWVQSGEHGNRTAVIVGLAMMVPLALLQRWGGTMPSVTKPIKGERSTLPVLATIGEAALLWWLVQIDDLHLLGSILLAGTVGCVAAGIPLMIPLLLRAARDGAHARRDPAFGEQRLARTLAASPDGPAARVLQLWHERLPAGLRSELEIVDEQRPAPIDPDVFDGRSGRVMAQLNKRVLDPQVGPGVRRQFPDGGWLLAERGGGVGDVTVTTSDGHDFEVSQAWRKLGRREGWGGHASSALAARLATGPALLAGVEWLGTDDPAPIPASYRVATGAAPRETVAWLPGDAEHDLDPASFSVEPIEHSALPPLGLTLLSAPFGAQPDLTPPVLQPLPTTGGWLHELPSDLAPLVDAVAERLVGQLTIGPCPRLPGFRAITLGRVGDDRTVELLRLTRRGQEVGEFVVAAVDPELGLRYHDSDSQRARAAVVICDVLERREVRTLSPDGDIGHRVGEVIAWERRRRD